MLMFPVHFPVGRHCSQWPNVNPLILCVVVCKPLHDGLCVQVMPLGASLKAKKGSKENTNSDLTHILGYTGTDMDIGGPPSPAGSDKEATGTGKCFLLS